MNEKNLYNAEYVAGNVFYIEDAKMNNGGVGVFFSFNGAKSFLRANKKLFSDLVKIKSVPDIALVNKRMMEIREGFLYG